MRVVLDTNLIASGMANFAQATTPPGRIVHQWLTGAFVVVVSDELVAEVERTLTKPYFRLRTSVDDRHLLMEAFRDLAHRTPLIVPMHGVATHPEDDLVLATAVSGAAAYVVTGDRRFRSAVGTYRGVQVISPDDFLSVLDHQDDPARAA